MVAWLAVWSNHFNSSFHFDDIPTIVENPFLPHLSNIPRYFTNPRTFSAMKDTADYRPLLSTLFALDYHFGRGAKAFIFQSENFVWFGAQLLVLVLLFRCIPGGNYYSAIFGAFLFAVHPITADTVNYPLQRGVLMGSFGVTAGLLIWIFWPRWLPQALPLKLKRVPQHGFDEYLRNNFALLEARYLKFIHAPLGLYLWPVVPLLLAEPATAVFAPILIAYILVLDTGRKLRDAIPAVVICGAYWIFQTAFVWQYGAFSRPPAVNYWITQPWVAMRYLFAFFAPIHLSADTDLTPFAHFWDPLALAGYAGVAALAGLAVFLGRRDAMARGSVRDLVVPDCVGTIRRRSPARSGSELEHVPCLHGPGAGGITGGVDRFHAPLRIGNADPCSDRRACAGARGADRMRPGNSLAKCGLGIGGQPVERRDGEESAQRARLHELRDHAAGAG